MREVGRLLISVTIIVAGIVLAVAPRGSDGFMIAGASLLLSAFVVGVLD